MYEMIARAWICRSHMPISAGRKGAAPAHAPWRQQRSRYRSPAEIERVAYLGFRVIGQLEMDGRNPSHVLINGENYHASEVTASPPEPTHH
jgi:hypothetical protein